MSGRNLPKTSNPLSRHATGLWFRRKGFREVMQRYDRAGEGAHWYLGSTGWHAYREEDVTPVKAPKR